MAYSSGSIKPSREKKEEFDLADKTRAKQRQQDDAQINPRAEKWRYQPPSANVKTTR
ncbi:hypothetical protein [Paraburkholderia hayleyella]|uniref:hypothetical protein n=1 Tax=Paraburkholderia hayleyella TaxID=2152889 RepID=UPI0015804778|nr:hypothetical protein [Paraburkholderia hayleyella]